MIAAVLASPRARVQSRSISRRVPGEMVVAEAIDFPGAVTQGFDLPDARLMIASALEDLAQALLEEGKPLPVPSEGAHTPDADRIELVPLSVHAGSAPRRIDLGQLPPLI